MSVFLLIRGLIGGFLLLQVFSSVVSQPMDLQVSQHVVSIASSSLTHHRPYS